MEVKDTRHGYLLKTEPAKITDAIEDGRLEGIYKIDFDRMRAIKSYSLADFDVDFGGYNYHVKFTPRNDRIDMQATIKFGGSQGVLAYEGVGYLSNFVSSIRMQITDGELTNLDFTNSGLAGKSSSSGSRLNRRHQVGDHGRDHFLARRALEERSAFQSGLSRPHSPGRDAIRSADISRF